MMFNFKSDIDQSSPQATIEGCKSALSRENWRLALRYMSPQVQQNMVGGLLMASSYASDGNQVATSKLIKIMQRHGLRKNEKTDIAKANLLRIVRDLMKWSDQHLPAEKKLNLAENAVKTDYSEYRIKDDRAYVSATCNGRRSETRLKCIDSRWYLI